MTKANTDEIVNALDRHGEKNTTDRRLNGCNRNEWIGNITKVKDGTKKAVELKRPFA